jgi:cytochrome c peroxidase
MRTRALVAAAASLLALSVASCKHQETKPDDEPGDLAQNASVSTAPAEEAPPPAPKVELPAAPPIPAPPPHLPKVEDSKDNPTTAEKVQLGHMLFFDKRLSKDGTMSCESCHHTDKAWTEGKATSAKVGGGMNKRNAPTMLNLAFHTSGWYWDGRIATLEGVSAAAWKGQLGADPAAQAAKLNEVPVYKAMFERAFGSPATDKNVPMALAAFFRSLKSGNSAFDQCDADHAKEGCKDILAGFEVFRKANCALCHVPPTFSDYTFHNVGVGMDKPADQRDHGRMDATKAEADDGKFKTPTLRDVALTAPYFHDGSVATLDEAIDFMLKGGKKNPNLDPKLKPVKLSKKDRANLKKFLESLNGDHTFTSGPAQLP